MKEPIYMRIKNELEKKIQEGVYQSGEQIPSERELSELFHISRMTARQAVNELVNEGLVKRERGRGTFVSSPQFLQNNIRSFTDTLLEQGYEPSTRLIEFSTVYRLVDISKALDQPKDTHYYKIKRLRLANNIPVALETVYIPRYRCTGLNQMNLEESLYHILKKLGYEIHSISCDFEACLSSRPMMKIFEVTKPISLLKVESVNYTSEREKLFYEEAYYRSNLYKYHVDIYRR